MRHTRTKDVFLQFNRGIREHLVDCCERYATSSRQVHVIVRASFKEHTAPHRQQHRAESQVSVRSSAVRLFVAKPVMLIDQSHSSWGSNKEFRFIRLELNPLLVGFLLNVILCSFFKFEHLSISNVERVHLPRWLRRDAERVPHSHGCQAPPRSPAIRREVYLAPHIFTPPYLHTD